MMLAKSHLTQNTCRLKVKEHKKKHKKKSHANTTKEGRNRYSYIG
jgi:hypothetical protein